MSLQISSIEKEFQDQFSKGLSKSQNNSDISIKVPLTQFNQSNFSQQQQSSNTPRITRQQAIDLPGNTLNSNGSGIGSGGEKLIGPISSNYDNQNNLQSFNSQQSANKINPHHNVLLSTNNNSLESTATSTSIQRKIPLNQWPKHQSSINSSIYSNGEVKSYLTNSRSRRSSEHKNNNSSDNVRHRFSLIPQVIFKVQ